MSGKTSVKVTIHAEYLKELDEAAQRALEQTAEAVHTEVVQAQIMPFKEGHLQNDAPVLRMPAGCTTIRNTGLIRKRTRTPEQAGLTTGRKAVQIRTLLRRHLRRYSKGRRDYDAC